MLNAKNRRKEHDYPYGKYTLEVYGSNLGKLCFILTEFAPLNNLKFESKKVTFSVKTKQLNKIIAKLDSLCYNYKIIKMVGFGLCVRRNFFRFGALAGICIIVAFSVVYPKFVLHVDGDVSNPKVVAILKQNGIVQGALTNNNTLKLASDQISLLDGVAFASVKKQGSHIIVTIIPEKDESSFVDIGKGKVLSKCQAIVSRVVVFGGTAVVKYGDIVKTGDVLIDDFVEVNEKKVDAPASGEVFGRVFRKKSMFFADIVKEKVFGQEKVITRYSFFGKNPKKPNFASKNCEISYTSFDYGFLIPFTKHTWRIRDWSIQEHKTQKNQSEMESLVKTELIESLPAYAKIKDVKCFSERTADGVKVSVTIESEEKIS